MSGENSWQRGLLVGAVAGLAGTYAMTLFHRLLERIGADAAAAHPQHSIQRGDRDSTAERQPGAAQDDATVEGFERLARAAGIELSERQKELAGPLGHYLFGTTVGAVYGALAAVQPGVTRGLGIPYGLAVWLLAEEAGIPAAGLAPPPTQAPAAVHARGALAHVVFAGTTEMLRRVLSPPPRSPWQGLRRHS